ncbi:NAD-dependent succinate-semialdehyde dehydrogenase [Peribacillus asahii]|uniref:NAD-dependent succinate-semialdehyde dehydrogenase n=1 Tax=Peribacillus asahii TaxID=228899 RepID=UPI003807C389
MELLKSSKKYQLFINGEWKNSISNQFIEVINPATGNIVGQVASGNIVETKEAIDAACDSFFSWSKETSKARADILMRLYFLLLENEEYLASVITNEMGKPIVQARKEVQTAAEHFRWNAEEARRIYGQTIQSSEKQKRLSIIRQPVGPVAAITPWNFPLSMVARKLAPALASGCTIVLKPAEQTPISAIELFKLAEKAGVPNGVINLVIGNPKEIGDVLLEDKRIRKITFTGSTEVGKLLYKNAAKQVKRVSMELGGHAPMIVFEDCDLESTVNQVVKSKFNNTGQTCVSPNRIYVQQSIKDSFINLFKEQVQSLKMGYGIDENIDVGPVVNQSGLDKVKKHVEDAIQKGATLVVGGTVSDKANHKNGYFYEPTVLDHVDEQMLITNQETFGPVAPIFSFETEDEVVKKANNTDYGLAAYIFTENLSRSVRVSEALEYGMVGINDTVLSQVEGSFGGIKESGIGREGGPGCLEEFLETKWITSTIRD